MNWFRWVLGFFHPCRISCSVNGHVSTSEVFFVRLGELRSSPCPACRVAFSCQAPSCRSGKSRGSSVEPVFFGVGPRRVAPGGCIFRARHGLLLAPIGLLFDAFGGRNVGGRSPCLSYTPVRCSSMVIDWQPRSHLSFGANSTPCTPETKDLRAERCRSAFLS